MTAEISLQDLSIFGAIENCAPCFQFANTIRGLFRVQLRHPPAVYVLAAAHRVGEMDFPIVAIIDVSHRRRHTALSHHGMRFAEQRFAYQSDANTRSRRLDGGTQSGSAGTDDDNVVFVCLIIS